MVSADAKHKVGRMTCTRDRTSSPSPVEHLESRRLLSSAVTAVQVADGMIVITGTGRGDNIAVVEHFPGLPVYDVLANGTHIGQFGGTAIRIIGRRGDDDLSISSGITVPATVIGGSGADKLTGGSAANVLDGGPGADTLLGRAGVDVLFGGHGNDSLDGGESNDTLFGGAGSDVLMGGAGDDLLYGRGGVDTINGDDGNDTIEGGGGRDALTGGPGADHFTTKDRATEILDLGPEDIP